MDKSRFKELEHTADLAVQLNAPGMPELLGIATAALHAVQQLEFSPSSQHPISLSLQAPDRETLLVQWLEEELYSLETAGRAWLSWSITMTGGSSLHADIQTAPVASFRLDIKAVTFHNLHILESVSGLETVVVFDV